MNLLMIWICSSVVSVYTVFNQVFKMIKEFADEGYKINSKDLDNINNSMPDVNESSRLSMLSMFIPIYNLFFALMFVQKNESNKDTLFMFFKSLGIIEEMEPFEINEYKKNPTLLNSVQVSKKYEEYLSKSFKITVNDRNVSSDFYCVMENGNLRIVKVDGFYYRYSEEEQLKYLCCVMGEFFKNIEKSYSSIEALAKSLYGEKIIIINLEYQEKKKEKDIESKSIKEKYVKLREEVKNNRSLYDDPYVDNDKSLRLE